MQAIDFPFRFTGGSLTLTKSYDRIIRAQIVDTLMTNYRERVMRPEYGADILSLLMSPADELRRNDTARILKERLTSSVPRALIEEVSIKPYQRSDSEVLIVVKYRVNEYSELSRIGVPISTGRESG